MCLGLKIIFNNSYIYCHINVWWFFSCKCSELHDYGGLKSPVKQKINKYILICHLLNRNKSSMICPIAYTVKWNFTLAQQYFINFIILDQWWIYETIVHFNFFVKTI